MSMQPIGAFIALLKVESKIMKRTVLVAAYILIMVAAKSQSREDVMYLKNGSIIRGRIIENVSGVQTSIELLGRNILVFPDSLVKMILMDQKILPNDRKNSASPVEMASTVNFYGGSQNSGGFTFITSYRFPFRLSIGAGLGIEWFEHQQIPFIADVRYSFIKGSWSPFVYGQSGYAIPLSGKEDGNMSEYHGGILAGAGAGMRFNFSKRNALVFNVGYRYQKTKTVTPSYSWSSMYPSSETIRYNEYSRMTFAFGFLFN